MLKLLTALCLIALVVSDELQIEKQAINACPRPSKHGDRLSMHYTGTLKSDGSEFDSSRKRGPFKFHFGAGEVIKGWDEGLKDMCVGDKRKLTIPPHMGYGSRGIGPIPGGATLVFEVELLEIEPGREL